MNIIVNGAGHIVMWSKDTAPTPEDGCSLVELDDEQTAAFHAARQQPNSGLTWDGENFGALPHVPLQMPVDRLQVVIDYIAAQADAPAELKALATEKEPL